MYRFKKYAVVALLLLISLPNLQNLSSIFSAGKAFAADCTTPGPAAQFGVYSTNRLDFLRPDSSLDPQTIAIGQKSIRMEVEVEDVNGCPVPAPASTQTALSLSDHAGDLYSTGNVLQGETYNFTIATGNTRQGFFVTGKNVITSATLTAATRPTSIVQLTSGSQSINVNTPAPVAAQLVFNDHAHGVGDTISGSAGAVVPSATFVRVYTLNGVTLLGSSTVNADGSFAPIPSGDDQYRQVLVYAEYAGGVRSNAVVLDQTYPSIVSDLQATHGSGDHPRLSWTATDDGSTFAIFRAPLPVVDDSKYTQIGTSTIASFTDSTSSLGVAYRYVVKQVNAAVSYTPEFTPSVDIRLDLSNVIFNPAGSISSTTTPSVSFVVTPSLLSAWQSSGSVLKAEYVNQATGAAYLATVTLVTGNQMLASAPYTDASGTVLAALPDGKYSSSLSALDASSGINDMVKNEVIYTIDTTAPNAPVLSKLRFDGSALTGLAGAVEGGATVEIYNSAVITAANRIGTLTAGPDGSFALTPVSAPAGGVFYLLARDGAGNASAATAFDVVSVPVAPDASKLTMVQNAPGTSDQVVGAAGAVPSGVIVRIYTADPMQDATIVPDFEVVAATDGSFIVNVGDNVASQYFVAVWSGAGTLSSAVMLSNTISIAAPASLNTKAGDNSVTLSWSGVANVSYYALQVVNADNGAAISSVTVPGSQTSLTLTLQNGSTYRFSLTAVDAFGNVSSVVQAQASPHAPRVVAASAAQNPTPPAPSQHIAVQTPAPVVTEQASPPAPSSPVAETTPTRDWVTWIIIGLGLLLLALAAFFGWQLWAGQSTEVVTTIKKPSAPSKPAAKPNGKKTDSDSKPRW